MKARVKWRPGLAVLAACLLAAAARAEPVRLACKGKALDYTSDLARHLGTREDVEFAVVLDLARGRLERAPVADLAGFALRDAGDAVFFVRNRRIGERGAFEWISISRVSGRYAHFVSFRDAAGELEPPLLMATAQCEAAA